MEKFFATCPRGLEMILVDELRQLGAEKVHAVGGGVQFSGDLTVCYRVNLESRIASRVLWQVATAGYRNENDILSGRLLGTVDRLVQCRADHTRRYLGDQEPAHQPQLRHSQGQRRRVRQNPPGFATASERRHTRSGYPDPRPFDRSRVYTLSRTSGEPFFKRGKRIAIGAAPLEKTSPREFFASPDGLRASLCSIRCAAAARF